MQVGSVSSEISGSLTEGINEFFGSFIERFYISGYAIRKLAHFFEFAVLAVLFCFNFYYIFGIERADSIKRKMLVCLTLLCSAVVACIDESIQLFVDGRVGCFSDVLIDSAGALLATGIFFLTLALRKEKQFQREA